MKEIWKPVGGFEGVYDVSNLGKVRSRDREVGHRYGGTSNFPGKILKPYSANGYPKVNMYSGVKVKKEYVHRLVAEAFIPNPLELNVVNHLDGNKENTLASNLEWVTYSENSLHAFESGIVVSRKGEKASRAILSEIDVNEIRERDFGELTHEEIGRVYGVSKQTIWGILNNRTWTHLSKTEGKSGK